MNQVRITSVIPVTEYAAQVTDELIEMMCQDCGFNDLYNSHYDRAGRAAFDLDVATVIQAALKRIL